jgi:uncharacterized protein
MASFASACVRNPGRRYRLRTDAGVTLATDLEVAVDRATRNKGLLGRDGLGEGAGMLIAPTNAVHTFFMRFPIDILFVRKDGRVAKVRVSVKPWRLAASFSAWAVVELPAGTAQSLGVRPGDRLVVEPALESPIPGAM